MTDNIAPQIRKAQTSEHPVIFTDRRTLLRTAGAAGIAAAAGPLLSSRPAAAAGRPKKITVVTGSPHQRGASFLLTDEYIRGASEAGAEIFRFDAAFKRVTACSGCDHCGLGASPCVYRDDMFELNPHLIDCDLVVLSTPLYYFGFSAQLKLVIDRFYAINSQLHSPREAVLIAAAWNSNDWTFPALAHHYETLVRYMGWTDAGQILGTSCGSRSAASSSRFPQLAYELGRRTGAS